MPLLPLHKNQGNLLKVIQGEAGTFNLRAFCALK